MKESQVSKSKAAQYAEKATNADCLGNIMANAKAMGNESAPTPMGLASRISGLDKIVSELVELAKVLENTFQVWGPDHLEPNQISADNPSSLLFAMEVRLVEASEALHRVVNHVKS